MTNRSNPHVAYRGDIDGLRAFAVVSVLIFHAFPQYLPGGFVGVDVFFVISGYLITSIILKALDAGEFSFRQFYARRIRRIFPALLVVVLSTLLAGWYVLLPGEYAELAKHSVAGLGFVANVAYWLESGYFDTAAELKPLLHLWSLGVEEQFYLAWPLLLIAAWKLRLAFWVLMLLAFVSSFTVNIALSGSDSASAYFLPFGRAWELLAGAALVLMSRHGWVVREGGNTISVVGLVLLCVSLFVIDASKAFPGWWALLPVLGSVLLIAAGPDAVINRRFLMLRPMIFVGLISYPLYLWHWPLLSFSRVVESGAPSVWLLLACLLGAFVLAWLTWLLLERPVRKIREGRAVMGLSIAAVLLAALSANIFNRDGMAFRLKDAQVRSEARALEWPSQLQSDAACVAALPAVSPGACLIAQPRQAPDVALIGDSHANHFYWGLSEALAAQDVNLVQLGKGACLPVGGVEVVRKGAPLDCPSVTQAAIDYAVHADSVKTVVIAARWMLYLTGREQRDAEDTLDYTLASSSPDSGIQGGQLFVGEFSRMLGALRDAGKRIVFVHAVPELGFNARECLSWQPLPFISRMPRPECAIDLAEHEQRSLEFRPLIEQALQQHPYVEVIDPADVLCDQGHCYGRRDGTLLYRDDDHLSLDGSRCWMAERVRP